MRGYELTDFEWGVIAPLLPNKPRGVPRVDDRRVLNGIFWVLRTGAPWRALPKEFRPPTTCYNRFVRWGKAGVWDRIMAAVSQAYDGNVQMIGIVGPYRCCAAIRMRGRIASPEDVPERPTRCLTTSAPIASALVCAAA